MEEGAWFFVENPIERDVGNFWLHVTITIGLVTILFVTILDVLRAK